MRALRLMVPLVLVGAWLAGTSVYPLFAPNQLPSPGRVIHAAVDLAVHGELVKHFMASVSRVAAGFGLGAAVAMIVGTLVGVSRRVEAILDPTLQAARNVPSLAWVPFLILWMGIDETPKIALIAIGAFFPVYLNLVTGIRQVDRKLIEVGYIFEMGRFELIERIILPSALPYLVTGLRIGMGQSWLFLVAAELIASTRGLGYLLIDGQNTARPDLMLVGILALALLGKASDGFLRAAESRALTWNDTFKGH